ncbi:fascin domain-containing protein [Paenibacillus sp. y28]|uniref:fascin domain-containing protein n=1 Tax=Paenibacillus sp. y28 TaxID=3129110 RepID=UPI0030167D13
MRILVSVKTIHAAYLSAYHGGGGELSADRDGLGEYEMFWLTFHDPLYSIVSLQTYDQGHYVCADFNRGGLLVADRRECGPWEQFILHQAAFRSYTLQAYNGMYACAEDGDGKTVVANRVRPQQFEHFTIAAVV